MTKDDFVWYTCYGSNLLKERFLCYISGGRPTGSNRSYFGCRDTSLPIHIKPSIINYELYFSKESQNWSNGGVAFISPNYNQNLITYARMYLISRQQLEDIARQETNAKDFLTINYENAIRHGYTIFKTPSWYGNLLYLGNDSDYPIFTLTSETIFTPVTVPSRGYLKIIIEGIQQSHSLTNHEIVDYLISKKGIATNYTKIELENLIFD